MFQFFAKGPTGRFTGGGAQSHDYVAARQRGSPKTEGLARKPLDEVAQHRPTGELLCHHEAEPRGVEPRRANVEREVTATNRAPKSKNG